jgi:hypothetical protein
VKEEIEKVLLQREPLYSQVAGAEIDTEGKRTIRIADEIEFILKQSREQGAGSGERGAGKSEE